MKSGEISESWVVEDLADLVRQFYVLVRTDPDLSMYTGPPVVDGGEPWHGMAWCDFDGREIEFQVVYAVKPSLTKLEQIDRNDEKPILLVTVSASDRLIKFCKKERISVMDLNGRAWLREPGLWVERGALPGRSFRYANEPRNVFAGKSLRIVRAILADRDRCWTQTELAECTGVSLGLVSKIVNHLLSMSYLDKESWKSLRLVDFDGLLDEWSRLDDFKSRNKTYCFSGLFTSPSLFAKEVEDLAKEEGVKIAFTQWVAASVRHPFTDTVVCSAYVDRLPSLDSMERLKLREVSSGGNLWLYVPKDDGVFMETRHQNDLTLVADPQIYVDLQGTGLRGPDAANALREWEGFCRGEI